MRASVPITGFSDQNVKKAQDTKTNSFFVINGLIRSKLNKVKTHIYGLKQLFPDVEFVDFDKYFK